MKAGRGFTLLEVLVATVILALSVTVLLGLFSRGLQNEGAGRAYDRAGRYAERLAEEIVLGLKPATGSEERDGISLEWSVTAADEAAVREEADGASIAAWQKPLGTLTIQVRWPSGRGRKTLVLRSLTTNPDEEEF
jgi:prepilin-type N-terminal cleavage/methylation domain-containing protein